MGCDPESAALPVMRDPPPPPSHPFRGAHRVAAAAPSPPSPSFSPQGHPPVEAHGVRIADGEKEREAGTAVSCFCCQRTEARQGKHKGGSSSLNLNHRWAGFDLLGRLPPPPPLSL